MTVPEFMLADIPSAAPSLLSDRSLIVISTPAGDFKWAGDIAWHLAHAAAATGKRVALIDLNFENPTLHEKADTPREIGIADAFLFGASLQHVAVPQSLPNLHFIGIGTCPADPAEVWASDRWQRLARGFQSEGAVLLLYLPAEALTRLPLTPDLIVEAHPQSFDPSEPESAEVAPLVQKNVPIVVVNEPPQSVTEQEPTPEEQPPSQAPEHHADNVKVPARRRHAGRRLVLVPVLSVVVIGAVVASVLLLGGNDASPTTDAASNIADIQEPAPTIGEQARASDANIDSAQAPTDSAPTPGDEGVRVASQAGPAVAAPQPETEVTEPRAPPAPPTASDRTLPYSIQVAAWAQLQEALNHLEEFEAAGVPSTIAVAQRDSNRVWYRVIVGAVSSYRAATDLRERLRSERVIGSTRGIPINTPYAFRLGTHADSASGIQVKRGLRESGIPAYIVSMPDGSVDVLLGAFESTEQADLTASALPIAERNLSIVLINRVGIAR